MRLTRSLFAQTPQVLYGVQCSASWHSFNTPPGRTHLLLTSTQRLWDDVLVHARARHILHSIKLLDTFTDAHVVAPFILFVQRHPHCLRSLLREHQAFERNTINTTLAVAFVHYGLLCWVRCARQTSLFRSSHSYFALHAMRSYHLTLG